MAISSDLESRTRFEPAAVEPRLTQRWLESGLWHPEPVGDARENYSIAIPPPNITGALHMGHALNGSIQDVLVRYHRMLGQRTKWIFGTDHASIATQRQVEQELRSLGTSREELGRERFLERVWSWRERYGATIVEQYKRLGASCDYEDERFTLDPAYADAVVRVFVELFERGYIHRDHYMVNWDPGSGSAISDLEVEEREETDTLFSIAYAIENKAEEVVIATVRPETMIGDVAVAVHPEDDRYRHLIGQTAILPLVGRRLPIIADDYVKPEFGTGALKVTPAHDPNDFEIGRRQKLQPISVIGEDGRMTDEAGQYAGLTVAEAREAVLAALEREGALRGREPYTHAVPYSQRSGVRIEPLISLQWFMRMDELARPAIAAVREGRVRFHPERWASVYLDWMESIRPWCVSRQLWWGHRLPVYYCDECEETYVARVAPERCGACGGPLRQDEDVLDTWFSSALWPFATLGWPEQTDALRAFYPTDVVVTAREIIFLWVARMIMMGLEFTGEVPFEDVYVHAVIQATDGRRMSKSLGTGVDPLVEIDRRGADAVRFGMLAMSSTQDVRYSPERIEQGEKLANKLFNAARFVILGIGEDGSGPSGPEPSTVEDRWILSRLARAEREIGARIEGYDFARVANLLYDYVYGELCDWYIELVKGRLAEPQLRSTLRHVLRRTLMLAHPVMPFVTEELWQYVREPDEGLLAGVARAPASEDAIDEDAELTLAWVMESTQALRRWRDDFSVSQGAILAARLEDSVDGERAALLARSARLDLREDGDPPVAAVTIPGGSVAILEGVDLAAHAARRERERTKLDTEIARIRAKLADDAFLRNAPAAVVAAEREKLAELERRRESL